MDPLSKQPLAFVASLVLVFIVIAIYQARDTTPTTTATTVNELIDENGRAKPSDRSPTERAEELLRGNFTATANGVVIDLSSLDAPKEINARALKLSRAKDGFNLLFTVYSQRRCMIGDFDIVRKELTRSPESKLLLTLEPLLPTDDLPPQSKEISLAGIESGMRFSMAIPERAEPTHFALYICKVSDGSSTCGDKSVEDLNLVMENYDFPGAASEKPKDKIYYFQYFLLDANSLTSFKNEIELETYGKMKRYLTTRLNNTFAAQEVSDRVKQLNWTIRSESAKFERNRILLNLPRADSGKCQEEGVVVPDGLLPQTAQ